MFNKEFLDLTENYEFDVRVFDEDKAFAGSLYLSPQKCTLKVMGERLPSENFHSSKSIKCSTAQLNFSLHNLKNSLISSQLLGREDNNYIHFFEYEFDIGFITFSKNSSTLNFLIKGIAIDFKILKTWIGHTTTQRRILDSMDDENCKSINSTEFRIKLDNYGELSLSYAMTSSWDSFSTINKSHPNLKVIFDSPRNIESTHEEISKLYTILAFFIGYDFDINLVKLISSNNLNTSKLSAYFPNNHPTKLPDYTLFPLGQNLRFDQELPALPLTSFNNYYNLSESDLCLYSRYLGYCRMKSEEEKFLGFFRLLEKLTYQKKTYVTEESLNGLLLKSKTYLNRQLDGKNRDINSLVTRILKLNKSKYNTQTCISIFFDNLPSEFKDNLSLNKNDLEKICKLRNDITHANQFSITAKNLYLYTSFIKSLLYLALLNKIGININQYWKIVNGLKYM